LSDAHRELNRSILKDKITTDKLQIFLDYYKNKLKDDEDFNYLSHFNKSFFVAKVTNLSDTVEHTYCLTMPETHKFVQNGIIAGNSQGSGFNDVIVAIESAAYVLLNAELLYTGITRAKNYCVLVGQNNAVRTAIGKREVKHKQTYLKYMLTE